jgi:hypothetical protein
MTTTPRRGPREESGPPGTEGRLSSVHRDQRRGRSPKPRGPRSGRHEVEVSPDLPPALKLATGKANQLKAFNC